ncbi:hypothetical protein MC885_004753 [Smutsia gigantea]|nr:hypothetical protein MC885_004753 [Smutsia gigantea]
MFKSTTVTVRENCNEISQRAVVDSVNNQEDLKCSLTHEENTQDATTLAADAESANNYTTKNNQVGDQAQGIHRHKIGFSFAFPKKASVRLESSAAAFSECNDDASAGKGFSRKSRFVPGACHLRLSSPTDVLLSSEEKANSFHPPEGMCTVKETAQTQEMKEVSSEKDILLLPSFCPFQLPLSSDADNCQNLVPSADHIPLQDVIINEDVPISGNGSVLLGNESTVLDTANDRISLQATTEENVKDNDPSTAEVENKNHGPEMLAPSNSEEDNITLHKKAHLNKRPSEPFALVLNKDRSTVLQWPSEMLIYTITQPSISYSCNPLCFDFKSTKLNNNIDKRKLPLNDLHPQQKGEDIFKRSVSDCKGTSIAGPTGHETGGSRNECTQVTPLLSDGTLANSCDSGKNENLGQRYKNISCRIRKTKKSFTKKRTKQDTLDEKYNKIRSKETPEHWFHKNRRKKKRRKLCQHHHGEKTKDSEIHYKMEMKNIYTDIAGKNLLETISEKQYLAAEQLLDSHQLPDKRPKSASVYLSEAEDMCKTWNAEQSKSDAISSKKHCTKNSIVLNGQSNPTRINSGKHNLTYSRTHCGWKAKMSSCSQDHRCLVLQNSTKCLTQNQAVKRGYNSSLLNESERCHRKRRQHSCSYSSDESLNRPNYSPDFSRPPRASPCKPRRKRRRKRSRFQTGFEALELRENTDYAMKGKTSLCHQDELIHEDKKEDVKPQEIANAQRNSEPTDQVDNKLSLQAPGSSLPSETNGETEPLVMEATSGELSGISNGPAGSSAPAEGEMDSTVLEHKERSETLNSNEKQIPFKVPPVDRNFRQSQPKSYLCHYELAEALPRGKMNEAPTEWLRFNSGLLNAQPPLPFREAHVSGHAFVTAEQFLAPLALPEQALLIPVESHDKFKNLPCEVYPHIIPPNVLANKVKFPLPPAALPPASTPLQPLPLQQPFCSTSVTTIHHTVLQQHAAAAAAGTFKVLQPHRQFLSQVPALTRTPLPQISVGPATRLCPGNQPALVAPPQLPVTPASVLHPGHLAFPPLPHVLFPSLLSPHTAVIPLQPLF